MTDERPLRERIHDIIFQHDSPAERAFDGTLTVTILLSVVVVVLDSVATIAARYGPTLRVAEWTFTILFTIEYALRLWTSPRPARYARSFYGIVDLLAILPSYLSILFPAGRFLAVMRVLRVIRVFRILKLAAYVQEASVLTQALRASRQKIVVFITTVMSAVVVVGSLMYLIEGTANPKFSSIPQSIYWAIVTLTTVGFGDVYPITPLGKALASLLMILGYGIIAVPTGIMTLELQRASNAPRSTRECPGCGAQGHDTDASYCRYCGTQL
ncbi:MAG TPA: ion transporter [Gemmatimonadaceae bacterium]|nr:ion transporter [Gemmatimonadaceae bacterium]